MKTPHSSYENERLDQRRRFPWSLLAAFLIPFLFFVAVMIVGRYEPFGNGRALLYSDEYHQYYPFFVSFRRALVNGNGLLWNWDVGMGMDFLGLYSYYLASPLNWLCVLFPESWALEYFAILVPIRLGLAGLFFAMFVREVFRKNDFSIAVFGGFYALCAFALAYQWNIMWLDSFALLPLVMTGMSRLLRQKKFVLYTVALFFAFASNYYIGYMVCIFVLLSFIGYQICRFPGFKRLLADLGRMALYSILALGMTLVLTLPGMGALLQTNSVSGSLLDTPPSSDVGSITDQTPIVTTKDGMSAVLETFGLNIVGPYEYNYWEDYHEDYSKAQAAYTAFKDALDQNQFNFKLCYEYVAACFPLYRTAMMRIAGNMGGGQALGFMEGLPNIYCGVGTLMLVFLFLTTRGIRIRDKICGVAMILFLMISFIDRRLDYAWHGFHFTNMIPYRFSFLLSFSMLYMAYHAWTQRHRFQLWQILFTAIATIGLLACSDNRTDYSYIAYNLPFVLLVLCILLISCAERMLPTREEREHLPQALIKRHRGLISGALICVLLLELAMNTVNFGTRFPYTTIGDYPLGGTDTQQILSIMQQREENSDFYRAEVTHSQTLNDGALNGYNGISTFSSSANKNVTKFLQNLGQAALPDWNRYCYEETSPVTNLFLNLKYMVERESIVEENPYFDSVYSIGNATLLENNAYLPLGFLAQPTLAHTQLSTIYDNFGKQNRIFSAATGLGNNVWVELPESALVITADEATLHSQSSRGYSTFTGSANGGMIHYNYTIEEEGFLCLNMDLSNECYYAIYLNGTLVHGDWVNLEQLVGVCNVNPGDNVEVDIYALSNTYSTATITAAQLDEALFRQGYDILNTSTLDITSFKSTRIEGTINCDRYGLLYTSIPSNGNWEVYVDGQKVEPILIENAMMGVMLYAGEHQITFVYRNKLFTLGLIASLVCLAVFIMFIIFDRQERAQRRAAAQAFTATDMYICDLPDITDDPPLDEDTVIVDLSEPPVQTDNSTGMVVMDNPDDQNSEG